jgi:uncharacterized protein
VGFPASSPIHAAEITHRWLEQAVIGLNLCPFAKAVYTKGQIHCAVTASTPWQAITDDLEREVHDLLAARPQQRDTSLLVLTHGLQDFVEFNGYLGEAERLLQRLGLHGVLQVVGFHPQFEFADAPRGDLTHATNRSPFPTLHLLREESVARAVRAFPSAEDIYGKNRATLRALGTAGWDTLMSEIVGQGLYP